MNLQLVVTQSDDGDMEIRTPDELVVTQSQLAHIAMLAVSQNPKTAFKPLRHVSSPNLGSRVEDD